MKKTRAKEITPGDRCHDPLHVIIPDHLLARVDSAMRKRPPNDAVWARCTFANTARPKLVVFALTVSDAAIPDGAIVNLRCATCFDEAGSRLSRCTRRIKRSSNGSYLETVYTSTWRPEA